MERRNERYTLPETLYRTYTSAAHIHVVRRLAA